MEALVDGAVKGGAVRDLFLPPQRHNWFSLLLALFLLSSLFGFSGYLASPIKDHMASCGDQDWRWLLLRHGAVAGPVGAVQSATGYKGG
jgi:hypothetical protein